MVSILLDPEIRTWMLIPLVLMTVMASLLRQGLAGYMKDANFSPMGGAKQGLNEIQTT